MSFGENISTNASDTVAGLTMPILSIVIPTCYNVHNLELCLNTIYEEATGNTEVIVVDSSSDGVAEQFLSNLSLKYLNLQVISNHLPGSYYSSCNHGIRAARGKYILLLSDNLELSPGWLSTLLADFRKDTDTAIVGGLILYKDNTIYNCGIHVGAIGDKLYPYNIFKYRNLEFTPEAYESTEIAALDASFMVIKRDLVYEIGFFDEDFANTFESADYCIRAALNGYEVRYNSNCRAYTNEEKTKIKTNQQHGLNYFNLKWKDKVHVTESTEDTKINIYDINAQLVYLKSPENLKNIELLLKIANRRSSIAEAALWQQKIDEITPIVIDVKPLISFVINYDPNNSKFKGLIDSIQSLLDNSIYEVIIAHNYAHELTSSDVTALADSNIRFKTLPFYDSATLPAIFNQAINQSNGEYVVLINNSFSLIRVDLEQVIKLFQNDDSIGIIAGLVLNPDNTINHAGLILSKTEESNELFIEACLRNIHLENITLESAKVLTASHDLMLIPKDVFIKTGQFPEEYQSVCFEYDFCFRAAMTGIKTVFDPSLSAKLSTSQKVRDILEITEEHLPDITLFYQRNSQYIPTEQIPFTEDEISHPDTNEIENIEDVTEDIESEIITEIETEIETVIREEIAEPVSFDLPLESEIETSFSPRFWQRNYQKATTVLIKSGSALSDILVLTALVNDLLWQFPHLNLYVSGNRNTEDIFRNNSDVKAVIACGSQEEEALESIADVVIDYSGQISSIPEYYNGLPYMDIMGNMTGIKFTRRRIIYQIDSSESDIARQKLSGYIGSGKLIGLQLTTQNDFKRSYPYASQIINELIASNPDMKFVLLGTDELGSESDSVYDCGFHNVSLRDQIAMAGLCDAFLTIDSAFFHIGHNLFQKPTLLISGATNPNLAGNVEAGYHYVRNEKLDCLDCYWQRQCNVECMWELRPELIADSFNKMLSKEIRDL
jgi:GT2 family glycosyltransferase/ADP-heptose:LPS heptosyltransferase